MKVSELIDLLRGVDQGLEVVVKGYEGGTTSLTREHIREGTVAWQVNDAPWEGEHGELGESWEEAALTEGIEPAGRMVKVVLLGRS